MKISKLLNAGLSAISIMALSSCSQSSEQTAKTESDATQIAIDNIMSRTSIRQFTGAPVSKDTLDTLVKAGMAAPTAVNAQPWAFVIVTEREVLDSLDAVHPYTHLKKAGGAIIVCGDMEKALDGENKQYWIQDCSAASENILLAAHAYGLGAVWCGVYPNPERIPEVKRVLSLPDHIIPLNVITIGYPENPDHPAKDKWNEANVHYNHW